MPAGVAKDKLGFGGDRDPSLLFEDHRLRLRASRNAVGGVRSEAKQGGA
jgi:hypothetical protein